MQGLRKYNAVNVAVPLTASSVENVYFFDIFYTFLSYYNYRNLLHYSFVLVVFRYMAVIVPIATWTDKLVGGTLIG